MYENMKQYQLWSGGSFFWYCYR